MNASMNEVSTSDMELYQVSIATRKYSGSCVCVCVRARARVCVCVCTHAWGVASVVGVSFASACPLCSMVSAVLSVTVYKCMKLPMYFVLQ